MKWQKIKDLKWLADRYDPRYTGAERHEQSEAESAERAQYMMRNKRIIIGGAHTAPLQAFAIRECGAQLNKSGRSVTASVDALVSKFDGKGWYYGTCQHNTVSFADVYEAAMRAQPWER